jgi:drug/metabolite transporter (DMT)-like permease
MIIQTLLAFLIAIIWGISPVLLKILMININIPIYILIFIQSLIFFICSIIYIFIYKTNEIYQNLNDIKSYIPILILISFFTTYIANILYIYIIKSNININLMILIISLFPIITIIFSYIFLKQKITINFIFGILFIFIGFLLIFIKK